MRLWSIHPEYLDSRGLVALWREALLAQAVLRGETRGYTRHPQLERFRAQADPTAFIVAYLKAVHVESLVRGYRFDAGRIAAAGTAGRIEVAGGQVAFEWTHLMSKLARRAPELHARWATVETPRPHPLFQVTPGGVEDWERP